MSEFTKVVEANSVQAIAIRNSLAARLGELNLPYLGRLDTALDARHILYDSIRQALEDVVEDHNVVIHGSGRPGFPQRLLRPNVSTILLKVPSVYASSDARVALGAAVLARNHVTVNIRYQVDGGNGFAAAMHVKGRERIFESPPGIAANVFAALRGWVPERESTFCDGLIYILDRSDFTQEDPMWDIPGVRRGGLVDTDHEWNADHDVKPLLVLRVSATLAHRLFTPDTIHVYSDSEMESRRVVRESKRALLKGI